MIWSRRTRLCKQETNLTGSRCRLRSKCQMLCKHSFKFDQLLPQLRERKKKLAVGETELVAYVDASRRTVTDTMGQKVRYWCWHWLYSLLRIFEETYWSTGHEWRMKHWRKETIWSENIGIWKQTSWEVKRKHHLLDGCSTVDSTLVLHGILPWSPVL